MFQTPPPSLRQWFTSNVADAPSNSNDKLPNFKCSALWSTLEPLQLSRAGLDALISVAVTEGCVQEENDTVNIAMFSERLIPMLAAAEDSLAGHYNAALSDDGRTDEHVGMRLYEPVKSTWVKLTLPLKVNIVSNRKIRAQRRRFFWFDRATRISRWFAPSADLKLAGAPPPPLRAMLEVVPQAPTLQPSANDSRPAKDGTCVDAALLFRVLCDPSGLHLSIALVQRLGLRLGLAPHALAEAAGGALAAALPQTTDTNGGAGAATSALDDAATSLLPAEQLELVHKLFKHPISIPEACVATAGVANEREDDSKQAVGSTHRKARSRVATANSRRSSTDARRRRKSGQLKVDDRTVREDGLIYDEGWPLPRLQWDTAAAEIPFLLHDLARAAAPRCFPIDWIQLRLPPAFASSPRQAGTDQTCWVNRRAAGGSQEDAYAYIDHDMTHDIDDNLHTHNNKTCNDTDVVGGLAAPGNATPCRSWELPPPTLSEYLDYICVVNSEDVADALRRVPVLGEALQKAEQRSEQSLNELIEVFVASVDESARREQQSRASFKGVNAGPRCSSNVSDNAPHTISVGSKDVGGGGKQLTWRIFAHIAPSLIQRSMGVASSLVASHTAADPENNHSARLELPVASGDGSTSALVPSSIWLDAQSLRTQWVVPCFDRDSTDLPPPPAENLLWLLLEEHSSQANKDADDSRASDQDNDKAVASTMPINEFWCAIQASPAVHSKRELSLLQRLCGLRLELLQPGVPNIDEGLQEAVSRLLHEEQIARAAADTSEHEMASHTDANDNDKSNGNDVSTTIDGSFTLPPATHPQSESEVAWQCLTENASTVFRWLTVLIDHLDHVYLNDVSERAAYSNFVRDWCAFKLPRTKADEEADIEDRITGVRPQNRHFVAFFNRRTGLTQWEPPVPRVIDAVWPELERAALADVHRSRQAKSDVAGDRSSSDASRSTVAPNGRNKHAITTVPDPGPDVYVNAPDTLSESTFWRVLQQGPLGATLRLRGLSLRELKRCVRGSDKLSSICAANSTQNHGDSGMTHTDRKASTGRTVSKPKRVVYWRAFALAAEHLLREVWARSRPDISTAVSTAPGWCFDENEAKSWFRFHLPSATQVPVLESFALAFGCNVSECSSFAVYLGASETASLPCAWARPPTIVEWLQHSITMPLEPLLTSVLRSPLKLGSVSPVLRDLCLRAGGGNEKAIKWGVIQDELPQLVSQSLVLSVKADDAGAEISRETDESKTLTQIGASQRDLHGSEWVELPEGSTVWYNKRSKKVRADPPWTINVGDCTGAASIDAVQAYLLRHVQAEHTRVDEPALRAERHYMLAHTSLNLTEEQVVQLQTVIDRDMKNDPTWSDIIAHLPDMISQLYDSAPGMVNMDEGSIDIDFDTLNIEWSEIPLGRTFWLDRLHGTSQWERPQAVLERWEGEEAQQIADKSESDESSSEDEGDQELLPSYTGLDDDENYDNESLESTASGESGLKEATSADQDPASKQNLNSTDNMEPSGARIEEKDSGGEIHEDYSQQNVSTDHMWGGDQSMSSKLAAELPKESFVELHITYRDTAVLLETLRIDSDGVPLEEGLPMPLLAQIWPGQTWEDCANREIIRLFGSLSSQQISRLLEPLLEQMLRADGASCHRRLPHPLAPEDEYRARHIVSLQFENFAFPSEDDGSMIGHDADKSGDTQYDEAPHDLTLLHAVGLPHCNDFVSVHRLGEGSNAKQDRRYFSWCRPEEWAAIAVSRQPAFPPDRPAEPLPDGKNITDRCISHRPLPACERLWDEELKPEETLTDQARNLPKGIHVALMGLYFGRSKVRYDVLSTTHDAFDAGKNAKTVHLRVQSWNCKGYPEPPSLVKVGSPLAIEAELHGLAVLGDSLGDAAPVLQAGPSRGKISETRQEVRAIRYQLRGGCWLLPQLQQAGMALLQPLTRRCNLEMQEPNMSDPLMAFVGNSHEHKHVPRQSRKASHSHAHAHSHHSDNVGGVGDALWRTGLLLAHMTLPTARREGANLIEYYSLPRLLRRHARIDLKIGDDAVCVPQTRVIKSQGGVNMAQKSYFLDREPDLRADAVFGALLQACETQSGGNVQHANILSDWSPMYGPVHQGLRFEHILVDTRRGLWLNGFGLAGVEHRIGGDPEAAGEIGGNCRGHVMHDLSQLETQLLFECTQLPVCIDDVNRANVGELEQWLLIDPREAAWLVRQRDAQPGKTFNEASWTALMEQNCADYSCTLGGKTRKRLQSLVKLSPDHCEEVLREALLLTDTLLKVHDLRHHVSIESLENDLVTPQLRLAWRYVHDLRKIAAHFVRSTEGKDRRHEAMKTSHPLDTHLFGLAVPFLAHALSAIDAPGISRWQRRWALDAAKQHAIFVTKTLVEGLEGTFIGAVKDEGARERSVLRRHYHAAAEAASLRHDLRMAFGVVVNPVTGARRHSMALPSCMEIVRTGTTRENLVSKLEDIDEARDEALYERRADPAHDYLKIRRKVTCAQITAALRAPCDSATDHSTSSQAANAKHDRSQRRQARRASMGKGGTSTVVIFGPTGAGRTTLLRRIALECIAEDPSDMLQLVPIFIEAWRLARILLIQATLPQSKRRHVLELYLEEEYNHGIPAPAGQDRAAHHTHEHRFRFLQHALRSGRALLLIDGIDEMLLPETDKARQAKERVIAREQNIVEQVTKMREWLATKKSEVRTKMTAWADEKKARLRKDVEEYRMEKKDLKRAMLRVDEEMSAKVLEQFEALETQQALEALEQHEKDNDVRQLEEESAESSFAAMEEFIMDHLAGQGMRIVFTMHHVNFKHPGFCRAMLVRLIEPPPDEQLRMARLELGPKATTMFQREVMEKPDLAELCSNPVMLNAVIAIFARTSAREAAHTTKLICVPAVDLPANRSCVLEMMVSCMLASLNQQPRKKATEDRESEAATNLPWITLERSVLQELALRAHSAGRTYFTEHDIHRWFKPSSPQALVCARIISLARKGVIPLVAPYQIDLRSVGSADVDALAAAENGEHDDSTGGRSTARYTLHAVQDTAFRFVHIAVQEFLAACAICRELATSTYTFENKVMTHFERGAPLVASGWWQTIFVMCGELMRGSIDGPYGGGSGEAGEAAAKQIAGGQSSAEALLNEFELDKQGAVMDARWTRMANAVMSTNIDEGKRLTLGRGVRRGGGLALGHLLRRISCLRFLDLARANVPVDAIATIGDALQVNLTLVKLVLKDVYLDLNQLRGFDPVNGEIFEEINISKQKLCEVAEADVELCSGDIVIVGKLMEFNVKTKKLDISGNHVGPEGAQHLFSGLGKNRTLIDLDISLNDLKMEGAMAVAQFISEISLPSAASVSGADELSSATDILTAVDPRERGEVTQCALQRLRMARNNFGPEGGSLIAAALTKNQTLTCIDLQSNHMQRPGLTELAEVLVSTTTLKELYLGDNDAVHPEWRDEEWEPGVKKFRKDKSKMLIDFDGAEEFDPNFGAISALAKALELNSTTTLLNIDGNAVVRYGREGTDALAHMLVVNTTLQDLSLARVGSNPRPGINIHPLLEAVRLNHTLTSLNVSSNELELPAAYLISEFVQDSPTLKHVNASDNRLAKETETGMIEIVNQVKDNTSLHNIDLRQNYGSVGLGRAYATMFDRTDPERFEDDGRFIVHFEEWLEKTFDNPMLSSKQMRKQVAIYKEKFSDWMFYGSAHIAVLNSIPVRALQLDQVKELDISSQQLGCPELILMAEMLASGKCTSLEHLNMSSNFVTNVRFSADQPEFGGIFAMAEAIRSNKHLRRLDLACTSLCGFNGKRFQGLDALSNAALDNGTLRRLNLQGNRIPQSKADKTLLLHAGQAAQLIMARLEKADKKKRKKGGRVQAPQLSKKYLLAFNPDLLDICFE